MESKARFRERDVSSSDEDICVSRTFVVKAEVHASMESDDELNNLNKENYDKQVQRSKTKKPFEFNKLELDNYKLKSTRSLRQSSNSILGRTICEIRTNQSLECVGKGIAKIDCLISKNTQINERFKVQPEQANVAEENNNVALIKNLNILENRHDYSEIRNKTKSLVQETTPTKITEENNNPPLKNHSGMKNKTRPVNKITLPTKESSDLNLSKRRNAKLKPLNIQVKEKRIKIDSHLEKFNLDSSDEEEDSIPTPVNLNKRFFEAEKKIFRENLYKKEKKLKISNKRHIKVKDESSSDDDNNNNSWKGKRVSQSSNKKSKKVSLVSETSVKYSYFDIPITNELVIEKEKVMYYKTPDDYSPLF